LQRAVETEELEPGFAGDGLDPVGVLAGGRLGSEVEVVGAVVVGLEGVGVARQRGVDRRLDLDERAGLGVVDVDRQKFLAGGSGSTCSR